MVWLLQLQKNGQCMCSPLFFQSRTCHLLGPVHVGVYFAAVLWKLLGSGFSSGSPHWSPCHCCLCQWNRVGVWIWSCQVSRPPGVPAPAACTLRPIIQVSQSPQHWWCGYWLHCATVPSILAWHRHGSILFFLQPRITWICNLNVLRVLYHVFTLQLGRKDIAQTGCVFENRDNFMKTWRKGHVCNRIIRSRHFQLSNWRHCQ